MTTINGRIAAWTAYYEQRDLVDQMKKDGLEKSPVFDREKKLRNELHTKAKTHK